MEKIYSLLGEGSMAFVNRIECAGIDTNMPVHLYVRALELLRMRRRVVVEILKFFGVVV